MQRLWRNAVVFYLGGMFYCAVELLWRQKTHGSMFVLGGLCFLLVGRIDAKRQFTFLSQLFISALIITILEFGTGIIVNRYLNLYVWDYSSAPMNLMGQVCLPFTLLWFALSGIAIILDDAVRQALFGQPMPRYRWVL